MCAICASEGEGEGELPGSQHATFHAPCLPLGPTAEPVGFRSDCVIFVIETRFDWRFNRNIVLITFNPETTEAILGANDGNADETVRQPLSGRPPDQHR